MSETENNGAFPATRWSLVLDASEENPEALADLCQAYWFPLYCYARRLRNDPEDARDLTQGFFERLLSKDGFAKADAGRGRLRSYLLRSLTNFANDEWQWHGRQKRGGNVQHVSIDGLEAEQRMALEPREELTPEVAFDRAWASQLLERALTGLESAYEESGKGALFTQLRDQLVPGGERRPYAQVAEDLSMGEPAVRLAAFKLRKRYQDALKRCIAETVCDESEIAEELAHLRRVFEN